MKQEGITGSGLSKQIRAVEVAKPWQQRQISIILGLRNKERKWFYWDPRVSQSYEVRGSPGGAEIIKDTGTPRNRAQCREGVENKHSILSPLAFQFPVGKETTVMWSAEVQLTGRRAEKETDRTESLGFPGRNPQSPGLVAITAMQFRT